MIFPAFTILYLYTYTHTYVHIHIYKIFLDKNFFSKTKTQQQRNDTKS